MLLQLPDAPASGGASASPAAQPSARQNKRRRTMPTGELDAVVRSHISVRQLLFGAAGRRLVQASTATCTWRSAAGPYGDLQRGGLEDEARWRAIMEAQGLDARQLMVRSLTSIARCKTRGGRHTIPTTESRWHTGIHNSTNTVSEEELQVHGGQTELTAHRQQLARHEAGCRRVGGSIVQLKPCCAP